MQLSKSMAWGMVEWRALLGRLVALCFLQPASWALRSCVSSMLCPNDQGCSADVPGQPVGC
eukprot:scaffold99633_cov18-Tisochrysis_lutea.AAC.1